MFNYKVMFCPLTIEWRRDDYSMLAYKEWKTLYLFGIRIAQWRVGT